MRCKLILGSWILPLFSFIGATAWADEPAYLGVKLGSIPEALGAHLKDVQGALIDDVVPGSPAEKAGLKRFDVIDSVNGNTLRSADEVRARIQEMKPGETVKLGILRGVENTTIDVALGSVPAALPNPHEGTKPSMPEHHRAFLGIGVSDVPSVLAYQLNLENHRGVLVGDLVKGSPAEKAGIEANDVLTALDGKTIEGSQEFLAVLSEKKPGDEVKIDFIHKGEKKSAAVKLGDWPEDRSGVSPAGKPHAMLGGKGWLGIPHSRKGRIILQGPDGSDQVFPLPGSAWKTDDLLKDLEKKFRDLQDNRFPEMKKGIEKALKDLEGKFKDNGITRLENESRTAVIRNVDGEYDITVRDLDGVRTVTVLKNGSEIAKDLPWEKLDSLTPDVRDRVQKTADSLKIGPGAGLGLPIEDPEQGIKA